MAETEPKMIGFATVKLPVKFKIVLTPARRKKKKSTRAAKGAKKKGAKKKGAR